MNRSLLVVLSLALPRLAGAANVSELVQALGDHDKAPAALEQLVAMKAEAVPALAREAETGKDTTARGWAVVGLSRIGGKPADDALRRLVEKGDQPVLVRTWAAAGRIELAPDLDALIELMPLSRSYPALRRPLTLRATALASGKPKPGSLEKLLNVSAQDYQLAPIFAPMVLASGPEALVAVMAHGKDQTSRMQAAGYLGTYAQQKGEAGAAEVAEAVNRAYAFAPGASAVPWAGGPLYVPGIPWTKTPATKLVRNLIAWYLFAEKKGDAASRNQISNNLNSLGLGNVVGYQPNWGDQGADAWLRTWRQVAGPEELRKLLAEQGLASESRYQAILEGR